VPFLRNNMNDINTAAGVLALHKTAGMTSHDAVNKIRRLYGTKQVGHTGTLDPMATGVLVMLIGRAAKFAEFLLSDDKSYRAVMRLGVTSDTGDSTGNITETGAALPTEAEVKEACKRFTGEITQIPPMYSALKVNGRKLVDLARKGITVEREGRQVTVFSLDCERLSETDYALDISCSQCTYIRRLGKEIGSSLCCGALMASLERTRAGSFSIDGAPTLEELEAMTPDERLSLLVGVEQLFDTLPKIMLPEFFAHLAHSGCEIYAAKIGVKDEVPLGSLVTLYDADGFFALAECRDYEGKHAFKPVKQYRVE